MSSMTLLNNQAGSLPVQSGQEKGQLVRTEVLCSHCELVVPPGLVVDGAELQFCCHGCETVYSLLQEHGMQDTFQMAQDSLPEDATRFSRQRLYAEFDQPEFLEKHVQTLPSGFQQVTLYLENVHCAACVWLLEKLPSFLEGIRSSRLDFARSKLTVVWEQEKLPVSEIAQFADRLGYPAAPYRGKEQEEIRKQEERRWLIRIAVAGACAGNVMLMAFALYSGMFGGMANTHREFFRWGSLLATIPAVFWAGKPFFQGAWNALRARTLHMDLPIAIGLSAGFIAGVIHTITGTGEVYFDTVTALIFLLLIGRWLQLRQQRLAFQATELLYSLTPPMALLQEGDEVREVPTSSLRVGDLIEIRAGDRVPVDSVVVEGRSTLNTSILTGESLPVEVSEKSEIFSGTINLSARIVAAVKKVGEDTRIAKILQKVEDVGQADIPTVRLAQRIVGYFVATVLCLAVLTLAIWWGHSPEVAIQNAIALLIVTCPCALGLATPLAINVSLGQAAKREILIKGGETLEKLATPGQIWLDKTGTLTTGSFSLVGWYGPESLKKDIHALEKHSSHPISEALVKELEAHAEDVSVSEVEQVHGSGIRGLVDGKALVVGSPEYLRELQDGAPFPQAISEQLENFIAHCWTPIVIARDGEIVGALGLGDQIRDDARKTIEQLKKQGWKIGILSGDHPGIVREVGKALDLDEKSCFGGVSPERKQQIVLSNRSDGPVVMVGDGVNDAAALAAADIGISVHGSAEASLAIADVFLARPGLAALGEVLQGARRTFRLIKSNILFSIVYNSIGATLAMMGILNPLVAAVLMPFSSLTVITNSYRSKVFADSSSLS